jgi:hypothetical protein
MITTKCKFWQGHSALPFFFGNPNSMNSQKVVTPVETGLQLHDNELNSLDSGFRRNDEKGQFRTFYGFIKFLETQKHLFF